MQKTILRELTDGKEQKGRGMKYGFGIDVGGTTCKMGLFEESGKLLQKWEIKTNIKEDGAYILDDIASSIEKKTMDHGIEKERLLGIGLGVPGPVAENGTVCACVNLGWKEMPVEILLGKKTGLQVKAANDANAAAMGEFWKGSGRGYRNLVLITLGTGVGSGIIMNGRILTGKHGAGGEIGHMKVNLNETGICNCGKRGCLEQYVSATGITEIAKKAITGGNWGKTVLRDRSISAKTIFDAAKEKDPLAVFIVEQAGEILGAALANTACILDPECFILGGGVSKAGDILLQTVRKGYGKYTLEACRKMPIKLAELGNDAGIYGCMGMLL